MLRSRENELILLDRGARRGYLDRALLTDLCFSWGKKPYSPEKAYIHVELQKQSPNLIYSFVFHTSLTFAKLKLLW